MNGLVTRQQVAVFQPFLEKQGYVVLDGALATELERHGADLRDPLWSARVLLDRPELIRQVHLDYFQAGADVATTASYQATIPGLCQRGLSEMQAQQILKLSVQLARDARMIFWQDAPIHRVSPLVAASIGCYGAYLNNGSEYRGDYGLSVEQLIDWHRPRLEILASAGADILACETIPCLAEAEALAYLLPEFAPLPAWVSFSCQNEAHLCHGERWVDAIAAFEACPNVVAVGINCTEPRFVEGLLKQAQGHTSKLLIVYPNRGDRWDSARHAWQPSTRQEDWGAAALRWYAAGARLIGGCCRTTPDTIRQIAQALQGIGDL